MRQLMHTLRHRRCHLLHHVVRPGNLKISLDIGFGGGRVVGAGLGKGWPAKDGDQANREKQALHNDLERFRQV